MTPYYEGKWGTIYHGDCREVLPQLDKGSAIVTDPPYELRFMGKSWDSKGISFQKETWGIIRNSCLPGAPLLSFGGTRTFHRIACAIEDAGWEIRDTVMWVYGSGFPKSLDISKAIDKQFGVVREVIGITKAGSKERHGYKGDMAIMPFETTTVELNVTTPATPEAQLWEGYGTALKPAYEPIILAMNPLDGTFANNALKHGVAGLNIDECRIPCNRESERQYDTENASGITKGKYKEGEWGKFIKNDLRRNDDWLNKGRFPANFIHDGSQMVMELFPQTSTHKGMYRNNSRFDPKSKGWGYESNKLGYVPSIGDNGSAARFFYCAKASKAERDRGCEDMEATSHWATENKFTSDPRMTHEQNRIPNRNNHPTVKPLALMTYLVKLVKMPEYNSIRDPFMGSGTTLLACIKLGIPCIGIDNDEKSCEIAAKRCCQEVMELV